MFSACPKHRLQAPLLGNVRKAVKKARLQGPTSITEKIELKGECCRGLMPGSHSGVDTHTRSQKNQVGSREPFNTISAPVWSVRAPSLQGLSNSEPVHTLLQTLRTDVLLWKCFPPDFHVFQLSRIVPHIVSTDWKQSQTLKSKLFWNFSSTFYFYFFSVIRLIPADRCSKSFFFTKKWPVSY